MTTTAPAKLVWTKHPVLRIPTVEQVMALRGLHGQDRAAEILAEIHRKREEAIELEKTDPLRHSHEPVTFLKARELLAKFDEIYLMGANREGKTYFAVKYVVEQLVQKPNQCWAFFHSSEQSSIRQQQSKVYQFLPPEWRGVGKLGSEVYVKYTKQNGFSGAQFILPNGSIGMFFNYKQDPDVLEGYALDGAWFDELVPLEFLETMAFRLDKDRTLKLLITFTAKKGYTPTVARAIAGARTVESRPAELLLPHVRNVPGLPPGHMPYVMHCANPRAAVLFFHTGLNPYGATEAVKRELKDKPVQTVKIRAYGWADKLVQNAFPKYAEVHRITRERFNEIAKKGGTRYCVADPGGTKNWFIKWYLVTPQNWSIVYREWPDRQRYDEWALHPASSEKLDWRPGPAQRTEAGRGMADYRRMILQLEGASFDAGRREWDFKQAEKIQRRMIDCRMGGAGVPSQDEGTSIIDLMAEPISDRDGKLLVPPMHWEEAPDSHVQESVQLLQDAMDYDADRPIDVTNCPRWYVVDDLLQSDLAYREFTGLGTPKDALKDIIDPDRYFIKSDLGFVEPDLFRVRGATHY